ncbi:MAG: hypothetical protein JKY25_07400 [Robiginitomaculum sp.]|nr:hypothetical protein [Robiginitomaculum sp.]
MNALNKTLKLMLDKQGHILPQGQANETYKSDTYIIVPRGDRRSRPIGWVNISVLKRLLAKGAVTQKGAAYILCDSYVRRSAAKAAHGPTHAHANQHRDLEQRDIYHPDGIKRPARINRRLSVFHKLAGSVNKDGTAFLQADEIEAGERFAADYDRSMMAAVATQNYTGVTSGGKNRVNTAENISISAMDARKRVMDALEMVGPGLERALVSLCGRDWSLGQLEAQEKWASGSGRTVLKLALSRLSEYYGCKPGISARR